MGRGIAVDFKNRWPDMYHEYRGRCIAGMFKPGSVFTWDGPQITVFNLATQAHWREPATLQNIQQSVTRMCFEAIVRDIKEIGMPRIGAGLGRLEWDDVEALLKECVPDVMTLAIYTK